MSLEDSILVLAEAVQELAAAMGSYSSKLESEEAPEPAQTTLEEFTVEKPHRDHNHMRRKFIYRCSICGLVGYNARSHPDHFSE